VCSSRTQMTAGESFCESISDARLNSIMRHRRGSPNFSIALELRAGFIPRWYRNWHAPSPIARRKKSRREDLISLRGTRPDAARY
jgi:hypothetical protein